MSSFKNYSVRAVSRSDVSFLLLYHHYAKRLPSVSYAFAMVDKDNSIVGCVCFGQPASHHVKAGACKSNPNLVLELNRLCILDEIPKNAASWLISRAMKMMPPMIIVSYADTVQGHLGLVYMASGFKYAGWSDMDRKSARCDYWVDGLHSRGAFRKGGKGLESKRVPRKPKIKYWKASGKGLGKKFVERMCTWPEISISAHPPPMQHKQISM